MDIAAVKERLVAEVDRRADVLLEVSHSIHQRPELAYEEHHAADVLTSVLEGEGFDVERGAAGMDTAFLARAGTSGPLIAVFCEYDALPEIGHACGHNIIGAAGLGAGLAAATVADELGGQVLVVGSPAEEGGGGKVFLLDRGALDEVDAAMMVHPADGDLTALNVIAIQQVHVQPAADAPPSQAAMTRGFRASRLARRALRTIHSIVTCSGTMFGLSPPLRNTPCTRSVVSMCWRRAPTAV